MRMDQRYILIYRISQRQYTAGCPVVVSAGALLRDTRQPRLVAQLKFTRISAADLSALTVHIQGLDVAGSVTTELDFRYENISARRGASFGQYIAVSLPLGETCRLRVKAVSAEFRDGTVWIPASDALWGVLPAITRSDTGAFVPAEPADLWYCSCGAVNRKDEPRCHRCGNAFAPVAAGIPAPPAAVQMPVPEIISDAPTAEKKVPVLLPLLRKYKKAAVIAALSLALLVTGLCTLPRLLKKNGPTDSTLPYAAEIETPQPKPGAAADSAAQAVLSQPADDGLGSYRDIPLTHGETGETLIIEVPLKDGRCTVNQELVQAYLPDTNNHLFGVGDLGRNLDDYIRSSYYYACLLANISGFSQNEYSTFDPVKDPDSTFCLLVFRGRTILGYFVGTPQRKGTEDVWQIELRLCSYDITDMAAKDAAAYLADKGSLLERYIPSDEVQDCGAAYYISGYNSGSSPDLVEDNVQLSHFWNILHSPRLQRIVKKIERFGKETPRQGRYRGYLLLDAEYRYLGYTILSVEDLSGFSPLPYQAQDRPAPAPGEDYTLYLDTDSRNHRLYAKINSSYSFGANDTYFASYCCDGHYSNTSNEKYANGGIGNMCWEASDFFFFNDFPHTISKIELTHLRDGVEVAKAAADVDIRFEECPEAIQILDGEARQEGDLIRYSLTPAQPLDLSKQYWVLFRENGQPRLHFYASVENGKLAFSGSISGQQTSDIGTFHIYGVRDVELLSENSAVVTYYAPGQGFSFS